MRTVPVVEKPRHRKPVALAAAAAADGADHMLAVDGLHRRARDAHAVVFPKQAPQLSLGDKAQPRVYRGDLRPLAHGGAPLAQDMCAFGRVDPVKSVRRLPRCGLAFHRLGIGSAVFSAQGILHCADGAVARLQTPVIRRVGGVVVDLVGENDDDRAHAHKLLFSGCKTRHRRFLPAVPERPVLHEGKLLLCQHPARRVHRAHAAALFPAAEQGIISAREIAGIVKLPVADARLVAVACKDVGHDALGIFIIQPWQQCHVSASLQNRKPSPRRRGLWQRLYQLTQPCQALLKRVMRLL